VELLADFLNEKLLISGVAMEGAARWLEEIPKTGLLPVGRKAMIRGELDGDFMVDIGAGTFLQMSLTEVGTFLRTRLTKTMAMEQLIRTDKEKGKVVKLPTEEVEIIEELSAEDLEFMTKRSKPRVAHTSSSTSKVHFNIEPLEEGTVEEDLKRLEIGPVKSRVIERASPAMVTDPAQTVIRAHVKESLFKRRTEFWRNNQEE
jgi:hypothetical protein